MRGVPAVNNIVNNLAAFNKALADVKAHPMCAKFEDDGCAFIVTYPAGEFGVVYGGVRVHHRDLVGGKAKSLTNLLSRMERDWLNSFPGAKRT